MVGGNAGVAGKDALGAGVQGVAEGLIHRVHRHTVRLVALAVVGDRRHVQGKGAQALDTRAVDHDVHAEVLLEDTRDVLGGAAEDSALGAEVLALVEVEAEDDERLEVAGLLVQRDLEHVLLRAGVVVRLPDHDGVDETEDGHGVVDALLDVAQVLYAGLAQDVRHVSVHERLHEVGDAEHDPGAQVRREQLEERLEDGVPPGGRDEEVDDDGDEDQRTGQHDDHRHVPPQVEQVRVPVDPVRAVVLVVAVTAATGFGRLRRAATARSSCLLRTVYQFAQDCLSRHRDVLWGAGHVEDQRRFETRRHGRRHCERLPSEGQGSQDNLRMAVKHAPGGDLQ
mmetsp:Transcript_24272/g.41773  ORF Transcript_24272/g.41773 Transcript_24272/m.41773 type:complete len:339 (-) Transcript_24272:56-1072(-)